MAVGDLVEALPAPVAVRVGRTSGVWRDYVTLTKPRIMSLLVLTAVCAMVAAAGGAPAPVPLAALVIGGALACGGASALNHVLDRDIDRLMGPRTASRPVAAGRISPARATAFGLVLSALAFAVLAAFANPLAAALSLSGGAFYVVVYTCWLKRSTAQNIVIGGAAGAIPPLAGWAAAHGSLGLGAGFLFLIVLLWTPPHFWALALLLVAPLRRGGGADDARGARSSGDGATGVLVLRRCSWRSRWCRGRSARSASCISMAAAILGGVLCVLAWRLWRDSSPRSAALLFHFSLLYLALLFVAVAIDAAVR